MYTEDKTKGTTNQIRTKLKVPLGFISRNMPSNSNRFQSHLNSVEKQISLSGLHILAETYQCLVLGLLLCNNGNVIMKTIEQFKAIDNFLLIPIQDWSYHKSLTAAKIYFIKGGEVSINNHQSSRGQTLQCQMLLKRGPEQRKMSTLGKIIPKSFGIIKVLCSFIFPRIYC